MIDMPTTMIISRGKDETKIKAFDCLHPGLEPQDLTMQMTRRAMGDKLAELVYSSPEWIIEQYKKRVPQLMKMMKGELINDYPGARARIIGEWQALVWYFNMDETTGKGKWEI